MLYHHKAKHAGTGYQVKPGWMVNTKGGTVMQLWQEMEREGAGGTHFLP